MEEYISEVKWYQFWRIKGSVILMDSDKKYKIYNLKKDKQDE